MVVLRICLPGVHVVCMYVCMYVDYFVCGEPLRSFGSLRLIRYDSPVGRSKGTASRRSEFDQLDSQLNFRHSKNQLNDFVPNQSLEQRACNWGTGAALLITQPSDRVCG